MPDQPMDDMVYYINQRCYEDDAFPTTYLTYGSELCRERYLREKARREKLERDSTEQG